MKRKRTTIAIMTAGLAMSVALIAAGGTELSVGESDGVYAVAASFTVPQPPAVVLAVLTDYERIPHFMPEVKSSLVRQRRGSTVIVEQEAVARVAMFSKRVHLLLHVTEEDDAVRFADASHRSFVTYAGSWTVVDAPDGGSDVSYQLNAQPAFSIPAFLLKRLMEKDAARMIAGIQSEIRSRDHDR
jgi:ribosome-associated toxin RatA of RatAB toxin-antitoxin module